MQVKVNDRLEFPKTLNMRNYMLESIMQKEKAEQVEKKQEAYENVK